MAQKLKILLIEDNPGDARLVQEYLSGAFEIIHADRITKGLSLLGEREFNLVLLDLSLPDGHGLENLTRVRKKAPKLAVVILTGTLEEEKEAIEGMQQGAQDYLLKGEINPPLLARAIRYAIERKRLDLQKDDLINTVSHELRTPLTSIRGSLSLIAEGKAGAQPDQARKLLTIAVNNCERMIRLSNDILDIEKIESRKMEFKMESMEVAPLVEQAVEMNRSLGNPLKISFVVENHLSHAMISADRDKFLQVMANLLSNAAKFSPAGGVVLVSLSCIDSSMVRVAVTNHGAEIPAEFRGRIFEKFFQANFPDNPKRGGTGLGLSISKAIVERMGGKIGFETGSTGTTFFFDLPEWREGVS